MKIVVLNGSARKDQLPAISEAHNAVSQQRSGLADLVKQLESLGTIAKDEEIAEEISLASEMLEKQMVSVSRSVLSCG